MNASAEKSLASWVWAWTVLLPLGGVLLPATALGQGTLSMPAEPGTQITTSPGLTVPMEGTAAGDVAPYSMQNAVTATNGGSYSGGGVGYSSALGTHLRARYNSESYGQLDGNFDLGTMKMWQPDRDSAWFVDGQVTLNDESKVGYNVGVGYRWMTLPVFPWSPDREKIAGISIWNDGSSAGGENFFPQVGVSAELLGDTWDFRANAYIPVGPTSQTRDFAPTGNNVFFGNLLGAELLGIRDTALTGGEVEVARRIRDLDAWAFGGAYAFDGGGFDTAGGRYGLRGYVTSDILAQFQMTHDELFDTNAVVGLTWFIGRTRNNTALTCTLRDRFREPVLRNDYVAMVQSTATGAGAAINNAAGNAQRFVHVDSTAAAGGDGSFERPLNELGTIQANSQESDIILAHAGSNLTGSVATLQNTQQFFGEGGGRTASFVNDNGVTITAPATATGAIDGVVPILNGVAGQSTVTLADNNRVENLAFTGGLHAIVNGPTGSANPNLQRLTINNTTGDGIALTTFDRPDTDDADGDNNTTETSNIMGNVVIDRVTFNNVVGNDLQIDGQTSADNRTAETLNINRVTSNGNVTDKSISISNTSGGSGADINIDSFVYNGGTTGRGALLLDSTAGPVDVTNSTLTGGLSPTVDVQGTSGPVTIGSTTTIRDVAGNAVRIQDTTGAVTMSARVTTASGVNGGGVLVERNTAVVQVNGDITANNFDAVTVNAAQAAVNFAGDITSNGTGTAVTITDTADPAGEAGTVTISGDITNANGRALLVDNGDDNVLVTGSINDTGTGILIRNRDANAVTTLSGTNNVINTDPNVDAVLITGNDAASIVNLSNFAITAAGTGRGLVSNGGQLNVTTTPGPNTITTENGRAIDITGGSSVNGVTFNTVTTTGTVASDAINVQNFNGTVTVNGGTINTTGRGAFAEDSSLVLSGVDINAGATTAVEAQFDGTTARTLTINTNTSLGGKDLVVTSSSTGGGTVNLDDIADGGNANFTVSGAGNLTANVDDFTSSNDNITMAVTGSGNGVLDLDNVNTGGAVTASTSLTSSGNLNVTVANSGNTTAFTGITTTDQGGGSLNLNVNNSQTTGGITTSSSGAGTATMNVTGSTVTTGNISFTGANSSTATANITNTVLTTGEVAITASNTGAFNSSLTNVTSPGGANVTTTTNGAATIGITNGTYSDSVVINGTNAGNLIFNMNNATINTNNNSDALSLTVGAGVLDGDIDIQNNTNIQTVGATALDVNVLGGDVEFRLNNNIFTNNTAGSPTAFIGVGGVAIVDLNVTNNQFLNNNNGAAIDVAIGTTSATSTLNLNLQGNSAEKAGGLPNDGVIQIGEEVGSTVSVFELTNTFNNTGPVRNNADVQFSPNNILSFDNQNTPPALPGTP